MALTRKNGLFAGSDDGAEHWTMLASLIETAKLNGLASEATSPGLTTRIVQGHPQSALPTGLSISPF